MFKKRNSHPVRKRVTSQVVPTTLTRNLSEKQLTSNFQTPVSQILTRGNKSKKSGQLLFLVFVASSVFLTATLFVLSSLSSAKVDTAIDHKYTVSSRDQKTCVFTISAMNNFGFALALYDSVMTNSPSIDCFLWFMGDDPEPKSKEAKEAIINIKESIIDEEKFTIVDLNEIEKVWMAFIMASLPSYTTRLSCKQRLNHLHSNMY